MADQDSANPDNVEETESTATDRRDNAVVTTPETETDQTASDAETTDTEAETPSSENQENFERARDGQADPDSAVPSTDEEPATGLTGEFGDVHDLPPVTRTDRNNGRARSRDGTITNVAVDQLSMGEMFNFFLELLSFLFKGDFESFILFSDVFKEAQADPNDQAAVATKDALDKAIDTAGDVYVSAGLDQKTPEERKEFYLNLFEENEFLKASGISKLFDLIVEKESKGGDPNIVWDSRNRLGISSSGLQPGDKTHGGLTVPDITTMTVNQVLDWQRKYLDEQKAQGIPANKRSTAMGAYQFIYTTLKEMRDDGLIDGDRIFNLEAQTELAIKRMIDQRGFAGLFAENVSDTDVVNIANRLRLEWEGAKHIPMASLTSTLKDIRVSVLENLSEDTFDDARNLDITAPVVTR